MQYFLGLERLYNCSEKNCVYHITWHFHFMEVLTTDIDTVYSSQDQLEGHITDWVNQLVTRRFPDIAFTRSRLLGQDPPYITISRYF